MKRQTGSVIGLLLMVCATAIAQEDPNSAGFHARHNTNSPYYDGGAQQAPAPPPVWADRWGAISFDGEKQVVGVSADMTSKRKAQETSVSDCKSRGGSRCVVQTTYHNQCAVVVAGNSGSNFLNAPTIEQATKTGMDSCHARNDTNCRVYYSGCSMPVRVQ
ncbi:DUF4189 domain-containing protein [Achromobacter xylosoxidans]